ncbi:MAG: HRDC domain-containing protein [Planctomycetota bacterium]
MDSGEPWAAGIGADGGRRARNRRRGPSSETREPAPRADDAEPSAARESRPRESRDAQGRRDGDRAPRVRPTSHDHLAPAELVTDDRGLSRLLEHLAGVPEVAIDTEADSFFSYKERVCLVQVSTPGGDFVVDPLAKLDLEPFGRFLADERVRKVFHDGEYDVLLFRREHDFAVKNIFDTRVASAALGYETVGLASALERHFEVKLDKTQQLSDWSKRPLTDEQIAYARLDTHYLLRLAVELERELDERGRTEIVAGECRRLEALDTPAREFEPDEFVRLKGARALDLARMQILRELFVARDEIARQRNVPPFKVLAHHALVELARRRPRDLRELEAVPGVGKKLAQRVGRAMLDAVERGKELGPLDRIPRLPAKDGTDRLDERGHELHDRLKVVRKKIAEREGYDASLALNRLTLLDLAEKAPTRAEDLDGIEGLLDWQVRAFGDEVVDAIRVFLAEWDAGKVQPRRGQRRRRG